MGLRMPGIACRTPVLSSLTAAGGCGARGRRPSVGGEPPRAWGRWLGGRDWEPQVDNPLPRRRPGVRLRPRQRERRRNPYAEGPRAPRMRAAVGLILLSLAAAGCFGAGPRDPSAQDPAGTAAWFLPEGPV